MGSCRTCRPVGRGDNNTSDAFAWARRALVSSRGQREMHYHLPARRSLLSRSPIPTVCFSLPHPSVCPVRLATCERAPTKRPSLTCDNDSGSQVRGGNSWLPLRRWQQVSPKPVPLLFSTVRLHPALDGGWRRFLFSFLPSSERRLFKMWMPRGKSDWERRMGQ